MEALLTEWGLSPEIIQKFIDNDITVDILHKLDHAALKELVPSVGTRIRINEKIREYVKENCIENDQNFINIQSPSTSSASTVTINDDSPNDNIILDITDIINVNDLFKKPTFEDFNLREVVEAAPLGQSIINFYNKNQYLDEKNSNRLVDIIMRHIYSHVIKHRLSHDEYLLLANKIKDLFPKEVIGTYYVPGAKKNCPVMGRSPYAQGKLVNKMRNMIKKSDDIVPLRRKRKFSSESSENETLNKVAKENITNKDLEEDENVLWLRIHSEPWTTVQRKWSETFAYRKNNKIETVEQFIEIWPILRDIRSDILIELDFEKLFPDSILSLYTRWDKFFDTLLSVKKCNVYDPVALEYIDCLKTIDNEDGKFCVQLFLLPYLLPPKGRIKTSKGIWKFSTIEVQEGLLVHVKNPADIDGALNRIRDQAAAHNQTVQPFLLLEGESVRNSKSFFIVVDTIRYQFSSAKKAFDCLFKLFHVFGAKYPVQSEYIYVLIENIIYQITTSDQIPSFLLRTVAILKESLA